MALYGLRVRDASGNVTLDLTDRITRLRYSVEVDADTDGSVDLSDIDGKETAQVAVSLETNKTPHVVERSGTTIFWYAKSLALGGVSYPSGRSMIVVFLYT